MLGITPFGNQLIQVSVAGVSLGLKVTSAKKKQGCPHLHLDPPVHLPVVVRMI